MDPTMSAPQIISLLNVAESIYIWMRRMSRNEKNNHATTINQTFEDRERVIRPVGAFCSSDTGLLGSRRRLACLPVRGFRPASTPRALAVPFCLYPFVVSTARPVISSASDGECEDCRTDPGALASSIGSEHLTTARRDSKTNARSSKNKARSFEVDLLPSSLAAFAHQKAAITKSKRPFEPPLRVTVQSSPLGMSRLSVQLEPSFVRHEG